MSSSTIQPNDGFESWIRSTQFDALNQEQRDQLQREGIDEAAYTEIRSMLLALQDLEPEPVEQPSDAIKTKLLDAFDQAPQKRRNGGLIFWIGGLSVAAAAAILMFFYVLPRAEHTSKELAIQQPLIKPGKDAPMEETESQSNTIISQIKKNETAFDNALKPAIVKEDISYEDEHNVRVNCNGPPDLPADVEIEQSDKPIAVATSTGSTYVPAEIKIAQTDALTAGSSVSENVAATYLAADEANENDPKTKRKNSQHLTTAMIDWLTTVY
jgi:hypothetical protein